MVTHLLTILDPFSLGISQFLCSQGPFVLVLLSGIAHKPQDAGFNAGEPGNGADRPVGCLWQMVGDNLGAVNSEGAVRVTEVTQAEEAYDKVAVKSLAIGGPGNRMSLRLGCSWDCRQLHSYTTRIGVVVTDV